MNLTKVMERMNIVRRARRHFLRMWAIDQSLITPGLDRVAEDLAGAQTGNIVNSDTRCSDERPSDS